MIRYSLRRYGTETLYSWSYAYAPHSHVHATLAVQLIRGAACMWKWPVSPPPNVTIRSTLPAATLAQRVLITKFDHDPSRANWGYKVLAKTWRQGMD